MVPCKECPEPAFAISWQVSTEFAHARMPGDCRLRAVRHLPLHAREGGTVVTAWVGTLSADRVSYWPICKDHQLWGSRALRAAHVRRADDIFVWQAQGGWLAHCRATTLSRTVTDVRKLPWPGADFLYTFGMEVIGEYPSPSYMSGNELFESVGLRTVQLGQFPRLSPEGAAFLGSLFAPGWRRRTP